MRLLSSVTLMMSPSPMETSDAERVGLQAPEAARCAAVLLISFKCRIEKTCLDQVGFEWICFPTVIEKLAASVGQEGSYIASAYPRDSVGLVIS